MWFFCNILNTHMQRLALYEDCIELSIPVDVIDLTTLSWHPYNPRKNIERYGCSITSLDGNDIGIPDLDSVLEYNNENQTSYEEKDFNVPTHHSAPFRHFLKRFQVGRCHYLKLPPGGFFPWHRDVDTDSFRIIYTIEHCNPVDFVWLEDDKLIELQDQRWYYINTRKKHCVFSFQTAVFAVFNVLMNDHNYAEFQKSIYIK